MTQLTWQRQSNVINRLRVITTGPMFPWAAMRTAAVQFTATEEYPAYVAGYLYELDDDVDDEADMLTATLAYVQQRITDPQFPENIPFTYYRAQLPDGTTEWEFLTTHGIGDDECGDLMDKMTALLAVDAVRDAAGVISMRRFA